ncbi:MAG: tripartite tricarboxylate transporter substrate-binding protein [Treponema sp.]|nr:tripartite tricarboxylate transporter substrate-binding protein [Treponema sp.]
MQFTKKSVCIFLLTAICTVFMYAGGQGQSGEGGWKPAKAIRIIVPWERGSPVDQVTRLTAAALSKDLGARVSISNQAGQSGSAGTKTVLDAPKDGYTWAAGMTSDLATYKILDLLDTTIKDDWEIFLSAGNAGVVAVNAGSQYTSFDQLLADFKANPGGISVATAGPASSGHIVMDIIRMYTGINYKSASYASADAAAAATASGEVPVIAGLAAEQAKMIKNKKIRPLAVLWDTDMNLDGYGVIPSIRKTIPNFSFGLDYFGIFIPKGVPEEVIAAVTKIWNDKIASNTELKKYAAEHGAVFAPFAGELAQEKALWWYQRAAWLYFDTRKTLISPNLAGIPRP